MGETRPRSKKRVTVNSPKRLRIEGEKGVVTGIIETPEIPRLFRVRLYTLRTKHANPVVVFALENEIEEISEE